MLPEPLHPAVVHFPMVLAALLPLSAVVALWAIYRGAPALPVWAVPLAIAALLTGTGWLALQTGAAEEERVEAVVSEAAIHEHEEAAERFLLFASVVTLIAAAGLARGNLGSAARLLATAGTAVVLLAAVQVGAKGGDLVYVHGAGSAWVGDGAAESGPPSGHIKRGEG